MGLTQLNFEGKNKIEEAIELIRAYISPTPFYGAFSGGKDSQAVELLTSLAGVPVDWHYCESPIDPPEVRLFIKESYPHVQWDNYARGFWQKVVKNGLPLRQARWCCRIIKEAGGEGRVKIVGVRRAEGANRSKLTCFEPHRKLDNTFFLRPIINWSDEEVWEFINLNKLPYCSLYDEGFKRIGCVLCPFTRNSQEQIQRFPKIAKLWRLSCDRIMERRLVKGNTTFKTGQELWEWWIRRI